VITQAEIIKNFKHIPSDFNKFLFCQLISEIVLKTHLAGSENAPVIFKLLYVCFNEIDAPATKWRIIPEIKKIGLILISSEKIIKDRNYLSRKDSGGIEDIK